MENRFTTDGKAEKIKLRHLFWMILVKIFGYKSKRYYLCHQMTKQ